jgi:hypothetical protein
VRRIAATWGGGRGEQGAGKQFFFCEKRTKKTFGHLVHTGFNTGDQFQKVFCFFFTKKKHLLSYP